MAQSRKRIHPFEGDEDLPIAVKKVKIEVENSGGKNGADGKVSTEKKKQSTTAKGTTRSSKKSTTVATEKISKKPTKASSKPAPKITQLGESRTANFQNQQRHRRKKPPRQKTQSQKAPRSLPPAPPTLHPPTAYQQRLNATHQSSHPNEHLWFHPAYVASSNYIYLPSGNPYLTRQCKYHAKAQGRTIYVVRGGKRLNKVQGIQTPMEVLKLAQRDERATKESREYNVQRKDERERKRARWCFMGMFQKVEDAEIEKVIERAFEKRSGRVGRTGKLELPEKIRKAVVAHIRHVHTDYDALLRENEGLSDRKKKSRRSKAKANAGRVQARNMVERKVEEVWNSWRPVKEIGDDPWRVCTVSEKMLVERGKRRERDEEVVDDEEEEIWSEDEEEKEDYEDYEDDEDEEYDETPAISDSEIDVAGTDAGVVKE